MDVPTSSGEMEGKDKDACHRHLSSCTSVELYQFILWMFVDACFHPII